MASTEKMDNEDITNNGIASRFTLSKWEKLPAEADDNNNKNSNGECLWIEGEKEDDGCPTMKEFQLDNGRTIMTVISMKSNKKDSLEETDEQESLITSSLCYPQQYAQKTAFRSEKQSQKMVNIDELKLHKIRKDTEPQFEISTSKRQLAINKIEAKTLSNINLGSKLVEDNWIKKMANKNLTKKSQPKETNCVRQMTEAIESKISRNNSFSNSVEDIASHKRFTQIVAPQRCKPRRNKTYPPAQFRPQLSKTRSENSEQTIFTGHLDTISTRTNSENTNEQLLNSFSERNENESKDLKKEFPVKEFIIKMKEIGRSSDQNFNIIEIGEKLPAFVPPVSNSSPMSWSCAEHFQKMSDEGQVSSFEKLSKSLSEKVADRHLSRIEADSYTKNTDSETDEPDASIIKKTTEIHVQLCQPKTSVRLKSPPSVNPGASSSILPLSSANVIGNEIYRKKESDGETGSEIGGEENGHKNMAEIGNNTGCAVTDTDIGYANRRNINCSSNRSSSHLVVKEMFISSSEDKTSLASNYHRKPMFLSSLKDEERVAGDPLTLRCEVVGWPEPKVTWKFDGIILDGQEPYKSDYDGRVAMLQLPELLPSDEGTYTCLARNDAAQCETNAKIKVLGFAPDIDEPLDSVKAKLGWPVSMQCRTKGNPAPKVCWTLNGQLLESNRHVRLTNSGDLYVMKISHLKSEDAGCYEFRAINPFGDAMCTAYISLEDSKGQKGTESDVKCVRPEVSNILNPLSKELSFSDMPETFASTENSPDEKCHVKDAATKNRSSNLNIEDSTDNKDLLGQSKDQSGSKDVNRNMAAISGITTMMNRAAKGLESAFQEVNSEEVTSGCANKSLFLAAFHAWKVTRRMSNA